MPLVFEVPIVILGLVSARDPQLRGQLRRQPADRLPDHGGDRASPFPASTRSRRSIEMLPLWLLFEGSIWLSVLYGAAAGQGGSRLGYSGRLMARAAVKAKQQATAEGAGDGSKPVQRRPAQAQRRRQSEPAALLHAPAAPREVDVRPDPRRPLRDHVRRSSASAQARTAGSTSSSRAQHLRRRRHVRLEGAEGGQEPPEPKGYRDLATAYETKGDTTQRDHRAPAVPGAEAEGRGGLERARRARSSRRRRTTSTEYQAAQQASQLAAPSQPFRPTGTLALGARREPRSSSAASQKRRHGRRSSTPRRRPRCRTPSTRTRRSSRSSRRTRPRGSSSRRRPRPQET